jgi:hypothetical protein
MSADQGDEDGLVRYGVCMKSLPEAVPASETSVADGVMDLRDFEKVRELGRGRFGVV